MSTIDVYSSILAVQRRLAEAQAAIGNEGRFSLTFNQEGEQAACYLTHWFRVDRFGIEDCRAIALGSVEACFEALDRYVAGYAEQKLRSGPVGQAAEALSQAAEVL